MVNVGKYTSPIPMDSYGISFGSNKKMSILGRNFFLAKRRIPRDVLSLQSTNCRCSTYRNNPKNPWDVMGCQVATCFEAPGVSLGGSGVSLLIDSSTLGILAHRTSEDERLGVYNHRNETHRSCRFHETILSFGEPGSLGQRGCAF